MSAGNTTLWKKDANRANAVSAQEKTQTKEPKLVFYDLDGQRQGTAEEAQALGRMMRLFSDRLRSIRRSSGGVSLAEPFQLLVFNETAENGTVSDPEYRVRVKFRDFHRDADGIVRKPEYAVHTKTITLRELEEPFAMKADDDARMRYMLDFGRGPIPVHVLDFVRTKGGTVLALFIEPNDWDRIRFGTPGTQIVVPVYAVDRTVLRIAPSQPGGGTSLESLRALRNYERLRTYGHEAVPKAFRHGSPVVVNAQSTMKDLAASMEESALLDESQADDNDGDTQTERAPIYVLSKDEDDEEGLIPFREDERKVA